MSSMQTALSSRLQASDCEPKRDESPGCPERIYRACIRRPGRLCDKSGDSFTIRNSQGNTRYDFIAAALANWAQARLGSTVDDISLLITGGPARHPFCRSGADPSGIAGISTG